MLMMKQIDKDRKAYVVKRCYHHLGGRLGAVLFEFYISNGWIKLMKDTNTYVLTKKGESEFFKMGLIIDIDEL